MRLRFPATFDLKDYQRLNITKSDDLLILKYPEVYRDKIRVEMRKIVEKNAKNEANGKEPVTLVCDIDIQYAKRSTDQNRWLWKAHEIEARLINTKDQIWRDEKGITWYKPGAITPEEIHESYNERYSPRAELIVDSSNVPFFRKMLTETTGKIIDETPIDSEHVRFTILKTSSYLTVAEFCNLADKVSEEMLAYGIDISNGLDWNTLMADLEGIKSRAVTDKEKPEYDASTVTDEPIVLKLRPDSVSIVENVFRGKREE
jgi:hypothetical protein